MIYLNEVYNIIPLIIIGAGIIIFTILITTLIILSSVSYHSVKVALTDPAKTLKYEWNASWLILDFFWFSRRVYKLTDKHNTTGIFNDQAQFKLQSYLHIDVLPVIPLDLIQSGWNAFPVRIPAEGVFEPEVNVTSELPACVEVGNCFHYG